MRLLDRIYDAARARPAHVILPEGQDPRVREAAATMARTTASCLEVPCAEAKRVRA